MVGAEEALRLTPDTLEWEAGSLKRKILYGDVTRVRVSYRPANISFRRYLTEIWTRHDGKLSIISVSARGPFNFEDRAEFYSPFVVEFARRVEKSQPGFQLEAGMPPWRWWLAIVFAAATFFAVLYVAAQSLSMRSTSLTLIMLAFGALFIWQAGTMLLRNQPRRCEVDSIPSGVLP
jgi:hypothetical protein